MAIYNTAITATSEGSAQLLASGSGNRAITTIIVCNTSGADKTLTLYAIPTPGTTASSSNMIVKTLTVPAGDTISFDQEKMVLATGDEIRAICDASGLTATVSILAV
jgi:hypothetical protein